MCLVFAPPTRGPCLLRGIGSAVCPSAPKGLPQSREKNTATDYRSAKSKLVLMCLGGLAIKHHQTQKKKKNAFGK